MGQRLWYAVESVSFAKHGAVSYVAAHGVQSAGMNIRFNLEQVFELGQAEIYEDVERAPDVECNIEKVLDGYPLLWHLATNGSTVGTLAGRSNTRCMVGFSLYDDTNSSASGTPITQAICSGMYPATISYDFNVNGPFRETLGLVGNDRRFGSSLFSAPTFNNTDVPQAITGSGGVNMREDFIIGEATGNVSRFPTDIEGVTSSGTIAVTLGVPSVYLQSVRVNANLGRDAIYSLGKRGACYRYVQFPVAIESSFEILSKQGDQVSAFEETDNLSTRTIKIVTREGTTLSLGASNKLLSVSTQLGNAQGGGTSNATTSYSYRTFSNMTVSHPSDPSGL